MWPDELRPLASIGFEPDLGDLAIALAVGGGVTLTVASGEAARALDRFGGAAAILRW